MRHNAQRPWPQPTCAAPRRPFKGGAQCTIQGGASGRLAEKLSPHAPCGYLGFGRRLKLPPLMDWPLCPFLVSTYTIIVVWLPQIRTEAATHECSSVNRPLQCRDGRGVRACLQRNRLSTQNGYVPCGNRTPRRAQAPARAIGSAHLRCADGSGVRVCLKEGAVVPPICRPSGVVTAHPDEHRYQLV